MKNILLLTNIYPTNDPKYPGTKICHFFVKEWQKMGYEVRVIHYESCFPKLYYAIGGLLGEKIMAITGSLVDMSTPRVAKQYAVDGVKVCRIPLKKHFPHGVIPKRSEKKAFDETVFFLKDEGFEPDVITAHFFFPQAQFLHKLKELYPKARTCMVMHSNGETIPKYYRDYKPMMESIDIWGFRSNAFKTQFECLYGQQAREFLCYSGIPSEYIQLQQRVFKGGIKKFVFIGSLYKLKNVDITLKALADVYEDGDYTFDVIGDGAELKKLKKLTVQLKQESQVSFHGRQQRDKAQTIMAGADCFVMVSSREAFGLVYLEAMAKGIIPVATVGQGFDGIIIDGENGFLCPSRDVQALKRVLKRMRILPAKELQRISQNAIATAQELTNEKVAEKYISEIMK